MNIALIVLLGEFFLVMFFFLVGFGIAAWKRKKRLNTALDKLLENIEQRRPERREKLLSRLQNDYGFDSAKAAETNDALLKLENSLLKKFFTIQLTQDSETIEAIGGSLFELLDRYFDLRPLNEVAASGEETPAEKGEIGSAEVDLETDSFPQSISENVIDSGTKNKLQPGTQGEQANDPIEQNQIEQETSRKTVKDDESTAEESLSGFSESADETVEQEGDLKPTEAGAGVASNQEVVPDKVEEATSTEVSDQTESQSEPEPSWDEAFAEVKTEQPAESKDQETATTAVSDQTESQSEPEPSWDEAFAETATQESPTETDASKKEEAAAMAD